MKKLSDQSLHVEAAYGMGNNLWEGVKHKIITNCLICN
jgi:hypothetical protein